MLILESIKVEKKLVLGDYMTVHAAGDNENQKRMDAARDVEVRNAEFFQRITKERGELIEDLAA